jgi:hypothetical protein
MDGGGRAASGNEGRDFCRNKESKKHGEQRMHYLMPLSPALSRGEGAIRSCRSLGEGFNFKLSAIRGNSLFPRGKI